MIKSYFYFNYILVPREGLEPSHPKAGDFESPVSTNFTIQAFYGGADYSAPYLNYSFYIIYKTLLLQIFNKQI